VSVELTSSRYQCACDVTWPHPPLTTGELRSPHLSVAITGTSKCFRL